MGPMKWFVCVFMDVYVYLCNTLYTCLCLTCARVIDCPCVCLCVGGGVREMDTHDGLSM